MPNLAPNRLLNPPGFSASTRPILAAALVCAAIPTIAQAETVRWARAMDAYTLDPHAYNSSSNHTVLHQMYETLVTRAADGALRPALATAWRQSSTNPNVWEFDIRQGVKFHDGTPMTASDVAFSINRARSPSSQMKSLLATITAVTAPSAHTVHIQTAAPNLILPHSLTNIFVMSEKWAKANKSEQPQDIAAKTENAATRAVNGTGAYRLHSREVDRQTVMTLNPDYWGRDQFPLHVTQIVYLPITAPATRVAALLSGEAQFAQDIPQQDVARLKQDPKLRINEGPENRSIFFGLNVATPELRGSTLKGKNPLTDPRVRQAIDLAIDRETIRRTILRGMAVPSGLIAPSFVRGWSADLAAVTKPDPQRARALLAEAGYPDGFDIKLDTINLAHLEATSTAVAGMLARVGIRAQVVSRPNAQHIMAVQAQESDFYIYSWGVPTYDSAYVFDFLAATRGKQNRGSANGTGYSNAALDDKIISLASEADPKKRDATVADIWKTIKNERFYIPLYDQVIHYASSRAINVPVHPDNVVHFKEVVIDKNAK